MPKKEVFVLDEVPFHPVEWGRSKILVGWACQDAEQTARNRRRFRITVLIIVMVLALTGTAAWLTERMS